MIMEANILFINNSWKAQIMELFSIIQSVVIAVVAVVVLALAIEGASSR